MVFRPLLAVALAASPCLFGCTTLLGIDGEYREAPQESVIGAPEGGLDSGAGGAGAGGIGAGGIGAGGIGAGGIGAGDAGDEPSAPSSCTGGTYEGTFSGTHVTSSQYNPVPGVNFPFDAGGTLFLIFERSRSGLLRVTEGLMDGDLALLNAQFRADIVGELDCATGSFQGQLTNGQGAGFAFEGEIDGAAGDAKLDALSGTWSTRETHSDGHGSGSWTATRVDP